MRSVISTNPRSGESSTTTLTETTAIELDAVMTRARDGQRSLSVSTPTERAAALRAIGAALDEDREVLVTYADEETALGRPRLNGEVDRAISQFELFATVVEDGEFLEAVIDTADTENGVADVRRVLTPIGTVGVFGAANFPLAFSVAGGDTASALAAGCAVVAKAHPSHPLTSDCSARAIRRGLTAAGQNPDCLSVVYGMDMGAALVQHGHLDAVGFTGSLSGGRFLHELATNRPSPIPFYGELGSLNPLVVTSAAAQARGVAIADGFFESFTLGLGQFCTKPGLALIPKTHASEFVQQLTSRVTAHAGGHLLNSAIEGTFRERIGELTADSCGSVLTTSESTPEAGTGTGAALAVVDAASTDWASTPLADECFGPFSVVALYDHLDEALHVLRSLPPALTGTIHAEADDADATILLDELTATSGRVVWNSYPTGVRVGWAMHHGGRYPASTNPLHTSVGATAIRRWLRPIAFQGVPDGHLPAALRDDNPLGLSRRVNGRREQRPISQR